MKRLLSAILLWSVPALCAAGELRLTDASCGAPLGFFLPAASALSAGERTEIAMRRKLPEEALKELDAGKSDAVIVEKRFAGDRPQLPLFAEALTLYISTANPGVDLTKAQVWEILRAPRPKWRRYGGADLDIQRSAMKLLAPGGTLIRRLFGEKEPDDEILSVDSLSAGFAFANSASLFFGPFIALPPPEIRTVKVGGVLPTTASITGGEYPLALRYVITYRKFTPELRQLLEELNREPNRRLMIQTGVLVTLPVVLPEP